jgi:hypothetical protein
MVEEEDLEVLVVEDEEEVIGKEEEVEVGDHDQETGTEIVDVIIEIMKDMIVLHQGMTDNIHLHQDVARVSILLEEMTDITPLTERI